MPSQLRASELSDKILALHNKMFNNFKLLSIDIESIVKHLLDDCDDLIHNVDIRVKENKSLKKKIQRSENKYKELDEITDLIGVRVITYYESDIPNILSKLQPFFVEDSTKSVDKSSLLALDQFGYRSTHLIVSLPEQNEIRNLGLDLINLESNDVKKISGWQFEIQLRSILQHSWAEIEHDLGYKNELGLPKKLRRKFSQIASILEIADDQFEIIKKQLKEHEMHLQNELDKHKLQVFGNHVSIDTYSLSLFVKNCKALKKLDGKIIALTKKQHHKYSDFFIERLFRRVEFLKISSFQELYDLISRNNSRLIDFCGGLLQDISPGPSAFVNDGISLLYLFYLVVLDKNGATEAAFDDYLKNFKKPNFHEADHKEFIAKAVKAYEETALKRHK